jgi:hypothetical protein
MQLRSTYLTKPISKVFCCHSIMDKNGAARTSVVIKQGNVHAGDGIVCGTLPCSLMSFPFFSPQGKYLLIQFFSIIKRIQFPSQMQTTNRNVKMKFTCYLSLINILFVLLIHFLCMCLYLHTAIQFSRWNHSQ